MDAVCLLMFPNATCCPDGYLCSGSSPGELISSSAGSYSCQPSIFPVVPPALDNPVFNASLVLPPLLESLVGPRRGPVTTFCAATHTSLADQRCLS